MIRLKKKNLHLLQSWNSCRFLPIATPCPGGEFINPPFPPTPFHLLLLFQLCFQLVWKTEAGYSLSFLGIQLIVVPMHEPWLAFPVPQLPHR